MRGNAAAAPPPVDVVGTPRVVIDVAKSLIQQCTVEQKSTPLPAATNPLASVLSLATAAFGVRTAVGGHRLDRADAVRARLRAQRPARRCGIEPVPPPAGDEDAAAIESAFARADDLLDHARVELALYGLPSWSDDEGPVRSLARVSAEIRALVRCGSLEPDGTVSPVCGSLEAFQTAAAKLTGEIDAHLDLDPPPSLEAIAAELAGLVKALAKYQVDPAATTWFANAEQRAACLTALHEALASTRARYMAVRDDIRQFRAALHAFAASGAHAVAMHVDVRPVAGATVNSTVRCVNVFTREATVPSPSADADLPVADVAAVVTFRRPARAFVSAGVLLSSQDRVQFTTETERTGVNAGGVATTATVVAAHNDTPVQAVPFSFLNLRIWSARLKSADTSVAASAGIGLNANSGSAQVEYFAGGAVAIEHAVVHVGCHYGRVPSLGGGFAVGQLVPATADLPLRYAYQPAWAVAVSYRIPLP
jgi:hypothetical protein